MADRLRCALIVGTMHAGGAEKQMAYVAQALLAAGVELRVYYLTWDALYGERLRKMGLSPISMGRLPGAPLKTLYLLVHLLGFRPHIIHTTHTYTNLYAALTAPLLGALSLGALRTNLKHAYERTGAWIPWLLRSPNGIIVNARSAAAELVEQHLVPPERIHLLPNVIDLAQFDAQTAQPLGEPLPAFDGLTAMLVARLIPTKRIDLFIEALAQISGVRGVIVGDGEQMDTARRMRDACGLAPDRLLLLGARADVPYLLSQADVLVLCSDNEGFSNVLLEAMAARLPIVATPAGDSAEVVEHERTGCIIPFGDAAALAAALLRLAGSPALREAWGSAGRCRVEQQYSVEGLPTRLLKLYQAAAQQQGKQRVAQAVDMLMR